MDLDLAGSQAEAELAARMLRDCPHLPLQEQVLDSLWQHLPIDTVLCASLIALRQKLSPASYESTLLACGMLAIEGNASVHPHCLGRVSVSIARHLFPCYDPGRGLANLGIFVLWVFCVLQVLGWLHPCNTSSIYSLFMKVSRLVHMQELYV